MANVDQELFVGDGMDVPLCVARTDRSMAYSVDQQQ